MTKRRWRTWLCGALAGLCAMLSGPAAVEAQSRPHWANPPRLEQLSRDDARLDLELDSQMVDRMVDGRYFEAASLAERLLDLQQARR